MKRKPLILVTNDDGITAPGIRALIEVANEFGEVVVVAPDSVQSGMGHAVTVHDTLYVDKVQIDDGPQIEYKTNGTPVDCVKLAISKILERKPDLVLSGINHGSNAAINVIYSGTMSAAVEGSIQGIPSIGFSLMDFHWDADMKPAQFFVRKIIQNVIENSLPEGIALNVNIPKLPLNEIKGIKVGRQANANWLEDYDERVNPQGRTYYWLTGQFKNYDEGKDTDIYALENNYVAVVPIQHDMTGYKHLKSLKNIENV